MENQNEKNKKMNMEAVMEIYRKVGSPGPSHKIFESMVGSWKTKSTCWMEPGKPPMESEGSCEQKMLLGGRFLQQEFSGDMMGSPFSGIGINGYDNHTGKCVSVWMDSTSTGIYFFEGTAGADGKTITQQCSYDDPVRGPMMLRSVTRLVDENTHFFEMYDTDKSGKEEKMMEITYTRKR